MRVTYHSINLSQLATTTDHLLAFGRPGKRHGPHVARAWAPRACEVDERTVRVAPLHVQNRRRATLRLVRAAIVVVLAAGAFSVGASHATAKISAISAH